MPAGAGAVSALNSQIATCESKSGQRKPHMCGFPIRKTNKYPIGGYKMREKRKINECPTLDSSDYKISSKHPHGRKLRESINGQREIQILQSFVLWCKDYLKIKKIPKITLTNTNTNTQSRPHTGSYDFGEQVITIYVGNRNTVDICRSIAHELVHVRQFELGMVSPEKSYPGSAIEILADAVAGKMIKLYGKQHREIFQ